MKTLLVVVVSLIVVRSGLYAQVVPEATGGATNFSYFLRYSQSAHFGGSLGDWQTANASGEVEYYNGRRTTPFNLSYVGGYSWTLAGPSEYSTGFFQYLSLHQVTSIHNWKLALSDNVSYRPQAPVTGLSGIPGTGEPIVVPPPPPNQSILTVGTYALNNLATVEGSRILNPRFTLSLGSSYDLLFYPDGNGLDTNTLAANGQLALRIDGRSSVFGEYVFSESSYPDINVRLNTNVVVAGYQREWSRHLHSEFGVGPEWINSSDPTTVPSYTLVTANAGVNYRMRNRSVFAAYNRGTGGGSGFFVGQLTDSVSGGYSCLFGRTFAAEAMGGYRRISPLNESGVIHSEFGAAQATWLFGRHVSVFVNYTFESQATEISVPGNVVNGPVNTVSFGTTLSPRSKHRF
jgi:hypothetical protein